MPQAKKQNGSAAKRSGSTEADKALSSEASRSSPRHRAASEASAILDTFARNEKVSGIVVAAVKGVKLGDLATGSDNPLGRASERINSAGLRSLATSLAEVAEHLAELAELAESNPGDVRGANVNTGEGSLPAGTILSRIAQTSGGVSGVQAMAIKAKQ